MSIASTPLDPADLPDCLALDQRALDGLWTEEQWRKELEDERRPCLGIRDGDTLVALACGWLVADELHITAVAVDPQHRRQGLGGQVLRALLQQATRLGARHATLEVSAANEAAQGLYAAAGFRIAGVRRAYYRNGDDALIQWVRLHDGKEVRITGQL